MPVGAVASRAALMTFNSAHDAVRRQLQLVPAEGVWISDDYCSCYC